ncbi:hypothetical protein IEQ34_001433 [Dendrobium chrysotoxum]|uniref:Uncharacterized protein n=1 Tax=Dendrobium chrysotoxum TaxID=161865 RepID=A0AAV7H6U2_DENCH|nr:hypothetical protein IEQ34_001433 [Dendrobium chrysotoxum]
MHPYNYILKFSCVVRMYFKIPHKIGGSIWISNNYIRRQFASSLLKIVENQLQLLKVDHPILLPLSLALNINVNSYILLLH